MPFYTQLKSGDGDTLAKMKKKKRVAANLKLIRTDETQAPAKLLEHFIRRFTRARMPQIVLKLIPVVVLLLEHCLSTLDRCEVENCLRC